NGGEAFVVAVIDDAIGLLLGPLGLFLRAEVIQEEDTRVAHSERGKLEVVSRMDSETDSETDSADRRRWMALISKWGIHLPSDALRDRETMLLDGVQGT